MTDQTKKLELAPNQTIDFKRILEDTKSSITQDIIASQAKLGLINEFINFFNTNDLIVVKKDVEKTASAEKTEL